MEPGKADPDAPWVLSTAPRHAHLADFDRHADVDAPATDRARLEQLCRYPLRPAVAQDRLHIAADDRVVLRLKTAWADGTRHLVFEPLTLVVGGFKDRARERGGRQLPLGRARTLRA